MLADSPIQAYYYMKKPLAVAEKIADLLLDDTSNNDARKRSESPEAFFSKWSVINQTSFHQQAVISV